MKNQKGITLIALIITIIVMLILAGIVIASAVADGGVIDRAQEAMKENERADVQEIIIGSYVFKVTASTNNLAYIDIGKTGIAIYENLKANGFTVLGAINAKDESGNNIKDENGNDVMTAPIKPGENGEEIIDIKVQGNHGEYEGTVTDKGLKDNLKINDTSDGLLQPGENESIPSSEKTLISMYKAGENCEEINCKNEEHLHIGDYVNYVPDTKVKRYYPDGENEANIGTNTGYITAKGAPKLQEVEQETLNWRVLGIDGENVLLISGAPTITGEIHFCGYKGYNNYENILNEACSTLYSKSGIGTARSITMNDIDTYLDGSNFIKSAFDNFGDSTGYYGYTNTNIISMFDYDIANNIVTELPAGETKILSLTSDSYYYEAKDYIKNSIKFDLLQGSNKYSYWVASRAISVYSDQVAWQADCVVDGYVGAGLCLLVDSDNDQIDNKLSLRPIVSLSSNVTILDVSKLETVPTE